MITQEQKQAYKALLKEQIALIKKVSKKSKITNLAVLIIDVFLILGLFFGFIGIDLIKRGISSEKVVFYLYLDVFIYLVSMTTHVIIHETGHLVFGLISGYKFQSFRIFSLAFVKENGRIQRKKLSIKGMAGQCLMSPPDKDKDGRFPFILYNLGGGLANLIISLPFFVAAVYKDNALAASILIGFSSSGLILAFTNLIPMDLGIQNDGMNIKGMLRHEIIRESFYLQLMLNAEMSNGKLITDYNPDLFTVPDDQDTYKYALAAYNYLYTYYRYLAGHDFESAYDCLTKILEKAESFPIFILNTLQLEQLFFMVLHHRPAEEIASLYKRVRLILKADKTDINIQRINYIYEALLTEEEKKDIMTLITKKVPKKWVKCDLDKFRENIEKIAKSYPVSGEAVMNLDIIDYCLRKFNTSQDENRPADQNDSITTQNDE
ncbi:MAG TPA: hypothetical protein PK304_01850 [Mobilitalea sp.]|nr:hypothetical protein [Mobilitalea sp.]